MAQSKNGTGGTRRRTPLLAAPTLAALLFLVWIGAAQAQGPGISLSTRPPRSWSAGRTVGSSPVRCSNAGWRSLKDENSQEGRRKTPAEAPELTLAGIGYNIGPDAQDRLRQLFASLLRHAARDREAATEKDASQPLFEYAKRC